MGYCDGAMDPNLIKRQCKRMKGKEIFTYGRSYAFSDGREYYGVKWKVDGMKPYDGHLIFVREEREVDIYDLDDANVVKTISTDDILQEKLK